MYCIFVSYLYEIQKKKKKIQTWSGCTTDNKKYGVVGSTAIHVYGHSTASWK
jgi:hypothetical protein